MHDGAGFPFSKKELCEIIRQCAASKVSKMKFGILELEFNQVEPHTEKIAVGSKPTAEIVEEQLKIHNNSIQSDEIRLKEQELDELPITDPLQYEELLIAGELMESNAKETG